MAANKWWNWEDIILFGKSAEKSEHIDYLIIECLWLFSQIWAVW